MIRNAILATDLSKVSDLLLDCIPQYKALGIENITVFHVPTISFNYMEYSGYSMRIHIEARMLHYRNQLRNAGFNADFVFREGLPSQEIVDYARQDPDALIIMGSKGHGFAKRNLLGSTTLRVIQFSHNPVLMIRVKNLGPDALGENQCALENAEITRHGIVLTDFSRHSAAAFHFVKQHLVEKLQRLSLMHVQDIVVMKHHDKATIDKFNEIDNERLRDCTISLRNKTQSPVQCILVQGAVVPEIMREAKQYQASLVVLGTHGKGYFSEMVVGSTCSALLQLLECNCLLVPYVNHDAAA